MRIGIVAPCWFEVPPNAYGGIEWMVSWLAEGLFDRGHEVHLIAAGRNHTRATFHQTFEVPPSNQLGEPLPEVVHAAATHRILDKLDLDVIHENSLAGPLLAPGRTTPTVVTAHGPMADDLGQYYRYLGMDIHMVAISDAQRSAAHDINWAGRVYNAIPVDEYPYRKDKEEFVLFLGRLSPEKGAGIAIEAAREAGLPLVLAGKCIEPAELAYFKQEVEPRMGDDIQWIGQADVSQKKDLLSRARCMVFPIDWEEPFGLVMAEAMACGTPVVALRRGSVPEVVEDEVTGFVLDDPQDLAKGIRRADQIDPAECRRRARELFDIPAMVFGYEGVYESVVVQA